MSKTLLEDWLEKRLPLYGHRNWIVIADSAYPAHSKSGFETFVVDQRQEAVVSRILAALKSSRHVRAVVHLDKELAFVAETDAPGVGACREWLTTALASYEIVTAWHEEIITRLDLAAEKFCVTVIKTNSTIPYTTVFLELDCAYWNATAESLLRAATQ